jgi:hypothetical protein
MLALELSSSTQRKEYADVTEGLYRTSPFADSGTRAIEIGSCVSQGGCSLKPPQRTTVAHYTTTSGNRPSPLLAPDLAPFSPLIWWRTRKPRLLLCRGIRELHEALLATEIAGQLDWTRAILGDAAVAIGVAIQQMKLRTITAIEVDLALSAVLACALEGDLTSPIVISSALRRRSQCDPSCLHLSLLWLNTKF